MWKKANKGKEKYIVIFKTCSVVNVNWNWVSLLLLFFAYMYFLIFIWFENFRFKILRRKEWRFVNYVL